jgi:hypothetical protein
MTGHIAAMSLDGTPISQTDLDRMAEEERLFAERQRQAARVVASAAHDVEDAKMLLSMLGLGPEVLATARHGLTPSAAPSAA